MRKGQVTDIKLGGFGSSKVIVTFEDGKSETFKVKTVEVYMYQKFSMVTVDGKGNLIPANAPVNPFGM